MRVSVPGIQQAILSAQSSATPNITPAEAVHRLVSFLKDGNVTVLTGAGVSVDSGIRAYRGHDGRYMNPNYKYVASDGESSHPNLSHHESYGLQAHFLP